MMNYWCLRRQLNNIYKSRKPIRVSAEWLFTRFRTAPLPVITTTPMLSPSTADPRATFSTFHRRLLADLQTGVLELVTAVDPLHSSPQEIRQRLSKLIKHHHGALIDAMEDYGNAVLIALHDQGLHTELGRVLEAEFSVMLRTICLFHEMYGMQDVADELELDQGWLASTKVVEERFPEKCLSPEQSLRRLKKAFPEDVLPDVPGELGKEQNEGPIIAEPKVHRGRLGVVFTMEETEEDLEPVSPTEVDEESPREEPGEEENPVAFSFSEDGIPRFEGEQAFQMDADADCPGEWEEDFEYNYNMGNSNWPPFYEGLGTVNMPTATTMA